MVQVCSDCRFPRSFRAIESRVESSVTHTTLSMARDRPAKAFVLARDPQGSAAIFCGEANFKLLPKFDLRLDETPFS